MAAYLSSVSASFTPPWHGLGAYATSKAALETPDRGVADRAPGRRLHPGHRGRLRRRRGSLGHRVRQRSGTGTWPPSSIPSGRPATYLAGSLMEVDELVRVVDTVLRCGASAYIPSVAVIPRPPV